jgi:6-phospho-beta-glucosidase
LPPANRASGSRTRTHRERLAPEAWFINFTNPAGLITQALHQHTKLHVVGICDTPAELLDRIAHVLGESV